MPTSIKTSSPLPQTAADLLGGLLRSQLFAESIYGQVLEQSKAFLEFPAHEYAAALVQRKVITAWQAGELLAGRSNFYCGTFRILGRLASGPQAAIFIAEQSNAQRLVILEASQLPAVCSVNGTKSDSDQFTVHPARDRASRHPQLASCIQVQTNSSLRLVAYEFVEAIWLKDALAKQTPQRAQAAHLVLQLVNMLEVVSQETLRTLDLAKVLVDANGQLKWLAGPQAMIDDWSGESAQHVQRIQLQMLAVRKFLKLLNNLPNVSRCRDLKEVLNVVVPLAEPWTDAPSPESIRNSRALLNRMLRKGPSLRQIEVFAPQRQVAIQAPARTTTARPEPLVTSTSQQTTLVASTQESPANEHQFSESAFSSSITQQAAAPRRSKSAVVPPARRVGGLTQKLKRRVNTATAIPARRKTVLLTAVIGAVLSGYMAMQWVWRWSVPEAKAQTDTATEVSAPENQSRSSN